MEDGSCDGCGSGTLSCAIDMSPRLVVRNLYMLSASWIILLTVWSSSIYGGFSFLYSSNWHLVETIYGVADEVNYVKQLRNELTDFNKHSSDILFPQSSECDVYILLNVPQHLFKTF